MPQLAPTGASSLLLACPARLLGTEQQPSVTGSLRAGPWGRGLRGLLLIHEGSVLLSEPIELRPLLPNELVQSCPAVGAILKRRPHQGVQRCKAPTLVLKERRDSGTERLPANQVPPSSSLEARERTSLQEELTCVAVSQRHDAYPRFAGVHQHPFQPNAAWLDHFGAVTMYWLRRHVGIAVMWLPVRTVIWRFGSVIAFHWRLVAPFPLPWRALLGLSAPGSHLRSRLPFGRGLQGSHLLSRVPLGRGLATLGGRRPVTSSVLGPGSWSCAP